MECETIKYDLTVSSLIYPSQTYYDNEIDTQIFRDYCSNVLNRTNLTIESFRTFAISFNVFYSDLAYEFLVESPKTTIGDLFAQMGGALGLFVSYSIFTLFELIELFILIVWNVLFTKNS